MKNIVYSVTWDKALAFMFQYDSMGMPYSLFIDRYKRCLIIAHVGQFYDNIRKAKQEPNN